MEYLEAKEILEHHNEWRKGADIPMLHPKEITEAINVAIKLLNAFKDPVSKCNPEKVIKVDPVMRKDFLV